MEPEDFKEFESDLFAETRVPGRRLDPDAVSDAVIEEEMSLFASFSRQNSQLGG